VDECKPLVAGSALAPLDVAAMDPGRGLHSSTFRLNVSTFCGIGGALRGCVGGV